MNLCNNCGKNFTPHRKSFGFYCSNACQMEFALNRVFSDWLNGVSMKIGSVRLKRLTIKLNGYICCICGVSDWNGKPITLDLDHIDGDSTNNTPENMRLLCPNCHSQTETYKGKNRGNGRHIRRSRYAEGKSF